MSGEPTDEELEKLRQKKMEQMQQRQQGGEQGQREAQEAQRQQAEAQKEAMLKQHLTDGARKRLNTVKMSKPEVAEKVEQQVLAIAQSGRLGDQRIDEDQMKDLLQELTPDSKSFNIRRR